VKMKNNPEYDAFNAAKVKAEMDAAIKANKAEREARGERKRGRKPKSAGKPIRET
jgi:hypothetical protein